MANYRTITVEHDGPVDWLTLNRPDRLNALNGDMVRELWAYLSELEGDYSRRVLVLRGAGAGFCAGLDLKAMGDPGQQLPTGEDGNGPGPGLSAIVRLLRRCPQPVISLVHGAACGGGLIFALASDIRIAGESARMNDAFLRLGLSGCELGMSWFLPRIVGLSFASELMLTGRFVDARRAAEIGLVSQVVPDAELAQAAREVIADMLKATPMGLRKTKQTLNLALQLNNLEAVMELEEHTQLSCMRGEDFAEALQAFQEKRPAVFGA